MRISMCFLAAAGAALCLFSCSSGDDDAERLKNRFDAGPVDLGANLSPDSGEPRTDCNDNPSQCAAFEVISAAPACACTGVCVAGYVYSAATNTCVPTVNDAGFGPTDTGVQPDSGVTPDGGVAGECLSNVDCPGGADGLCVNPETATLCDNPTNCICIQSCDWTGPNDQSGCPPGAACQYFGLPIVDAVCIADSGGRTQEQSCTAVFDANGMVASDDCNNTQNFYCFGATPMAPTGLCIRYCNAVADNVCASLGPYACEPVPNAPANLGLCLGPRPTETDFSEPCPPAQCQSNFCSATLGGVCSNRCDGLQQCPANAICVGTQTEGPICAAFCSPGATGNATCQQIDAALTCFDLGQGDGLCVRN